MLKNSKMYEFSIKNSFVGIANWNDFLYFIGAHGTTSSPVLLCSSNVYTFSISFSCGGKRSNIYIN